MNAIGEHAALRELRSLSLPVVLVLVAVLTWVPPGEAQSVTQLDTKEPQRNPPENLEAYRQHPGVALANRMETMTVHGFRSRKPLFIRVWSDEGVLGVYRLEYREMTVRVAIDLPFPAVW